MKLQVFLQLHSPPLHVLLLLPVQISPRSGAGNNMKVLDILGNKDLILVVPRQEHSSKKDLQEDLSTDAQSNWTQFASLNSSPSERTVPIIVFFAK